MYSTTPSSVADFLALRARCDISSKMFWALTAKSTLPSSYSLRST
jgi:hypothetical protein